MFKSIRMLLAIAAFHDYEIWQMDIKTVFLNGNLEDGVYMIQPTGFEDPKMLGRYARFSNPFMD
jgi:Reverse transcriptase (RNA-dependent DNA polymerase)